MRLEETKNQLNNNNNNTIEPLNEGEAIPRFSTVQVNSPLWNKTRPNNNLYQRAQLIPQEQATRKNLVNAINTFAAFTRPLLVKHRFYHPTSAAERVTLPRKQGGRGLIDVSARHKKQILSMINYMKDKSKRLA
jgi:hypothetical protein